MMKKIFCSLFALFILAFAFTGCTSPAKSGSPSGSVTPGVSKTAVITPTPTINPDDIRVPIGKMIVHFIDVGYGEAILIQTPNSKNILIDGGKADQGVRLSAYISNLGIKKIDYLMMSYPADDRAGGLATIVQNFKIGGFYMPQIGNDKQSFNTLMSALGAKNINPLYVGPGTFIQADDEVTLSVLSPSLANYDYLTDYSMVIRLVYRNNSMLLMGGAGEIAENQMIASNLDIKADVIKLGNYGTYKTSSANFLSKVAPQFAVLFTWPANAPALPNMDVLYRLTDAGIGLYKTEDGTVIVNCDGTNIEFNRLPAKNALRPTPEPTAAPTATPAPTNSPKPTQSPKKN